jgi:HK97 gp10 family phage protein
MAVMTMRLVGLDALQRALTAQPAVVKAHLQGVIQSTAFSIAQRIHASVPVDTGALKESIQASRVSGLTGGVAVATGVIRGRRPEIYWRFVEFGTLHRGARPTIRTAAQAEVPDLENRVTHMASDIERGLTAGVGV